MELRSRSRLPFQLRTLQVLGVALAFTFLLLGRAEKKVGIYEPEHRWPKNSVQVCVANEKTRVSDIFATSMQVNASAKYQFSFLFKAWSPEQVRDVRTAVTSEYTLAETGIEFIGWEDCPNDVQNAKVDVVLVPIRIPKKNPFGKFPIFGEADIGPVPGRPGVVFIAPGEHGSPEADRKVLQLLALHEFGHIAGLRHEHLSRAGILPDGKNSATAGDRTAVTDPVCRSLVEMEALHEQPVIPSEGLAAKAATTYDQSSVMSYCLGFLIDQLDAKLREDLRQGLARLDTSLGRLNDHLQGKTLAAHGYFLDSRNSKIILKNPTASGVDVHYEFTPRLSSGDIRALRCLYGLESGAACMSVFVQKLRPSPTFPSGRVRVQVSPDLRKEVLAQGKRHSAALQVRHLLFAEGSANLVATSELMPWKTKPHCRVSLEGMSKRTPKLKDLQRWVKLTHTFPLIRERSELSKLLGDAEVDLETVHGQWICSSDLENGESRITENTLKRIFGASVSIGR